MVYAKLEANLNIILAPKINLAVKNEFNLQINAIIALVYAKLEANLNIILAPKISLAVKNEFNLQINAIIAQLNVQIINQINIKLLSIEANLYVKLLAQLNVQIINQINLKMPSLNIDFSPVLNVLVRMQNQLNIQQNNQLNIKNNLSIQQNNLLNIQAKLNIQQNNLTTIEDKVTPEVFVRKGECIEPLEEGDWYQYNELESTHGQGLEEILTYVTYQIQDLHKEVCKAVQPKITPKELPKLIECVENPETGAMEVQELSLETMQANFGFVAPWVIGGAKKYVVPFLIDKAIEWGQQLLTEQTKKTYALICNTIENENCCSVLIPDPSAVWNTEGNYIFFHWRIQAPLDQNGNEQPDLLTKKEKQWKNVTQLADPIDGILTPDDPNAVWNIYFANIRQQLGDQWGEIRTKNKARRYPLYKGWFADKGEAIRALFSMASLSKIEVDTKNNPSYPKKDNQSTNLVNQGKTIVLRKVCVGRKHQDSDNVEILKGYQPPKS